MSLETEHSGLISNCSDGGKSLGKVTGLLTTEVESLCNCTWKPNEQGEGLKQSEVSGPRHMTLSLLPKALVSWVGSTW